MSRLYLDNAATSFPKPDCVHAAVDRYQREIGVAAGRGTSRRAGEVQSIIDRCRRRLATLFGTASPDRIVFTFNGTDSLNLALHGVLRAGDHVVTTVLEHNSVLRPLEHLRRSRGVEVDFVSTDALGRVDLDELMRVVRPATRLIAVTHASNVTGLVQPLDDIAGIARDVGCLLLIDAAQTAGHLPIDVRALGIDMLACSGHKGLLGPLGTGVLYVRPGLEDHLVPLRQGGTGTVSESIEQPAQLPFRYESGNLNVPGIVGLDAALGWLEETGLEARRRREQGLRQHLCESLAAIGGVTVYPQSDQSSAAVPASAEHIGVVSFNLAGFDPQSLAAILDDSFDIETRPGLHCAPLAHRDLGTAEGGGTVRLSTGPFTTVDDIDRCCDAVREIAGG